MPAARIYLLALLSGFAALVYEIVWTREVGLVVGSQVEAISAVLGAYFGGLALGAVALGVVADRVRRPLALYGVLEIAAAAAAAASPLLLRRLGASGLAADSPVGALVLACGLVAAVTFLLGGTLPALLAALPADLAGTARRSGRLVGANTAGAVLGVGAAAAVIPAAGLLRTIGGAAVVAAIVGILAMVWARRVKPAAVRDTPVRPLAPAGAPPWVFIVAAAAGAATLAFEVLAARAASLWLGSSLLAWAVVLGLFLVGLALGNWLAARASSGADSPLRTLGRLEVIAAVIVAAGITWAVPRPTAPAGGLTLVGLGAVVLWVLPATTLMGAAFPFMVRLAVHRGDRRATSFGAVSAANTAGGIGGAVAGSFVLLPLLGLSGALTACSIVNGIIGLACLVGAREPRRFAGVLAAGLLVAAACLLEHLPWPMPAGADRVLHISDGRQATAVVLRQLGQRVLVVDGDPEAATGGTARQTETLLGVLPIILHENPESLLEVGLGSGITLGTAAALPVQRLECVEIADAVLDCAPFFEPDNGGAWRGDGERIVVRRGDGRAYLARRTASCDVIVANTLHPWSVGATGLYSRQYFGRIRDALKPGGVAGQWVPLDRIGDEHLRLIVRTFLASFPDGAVWWGADNLLLIGRVPDGRPPAGPRYEIAADILRGIGIGSRSDLLARRLASRDEALAALGEGPLLDDDRPVLEAAAFDRAGRTTAGAEFAVTESIARAGLGNDAPMVRWLASRVLRARGETADADELEGEAIAAGLTVARQAAADRSAREGLTALAGGRAAEAAKLFDEAMQLVPDHAMAQYGLVMAAAGAGQPAIALRRAEQLVRTHPKHADGWNVLGVLRRQARNPVGAAAAFTAALEADPFFPDALANAGLLAHREGDLATARVMLGRLEAVSPYGGARVRALREAVEGG